MKLEFDKPYLRELYFTKEARKKYRFPDNIIEKYVYILNLMKSEKNIFGLFKYNSLNYKKLSGKKKGISAVRINKKYRIEFIEKTENDEKITTICNITELSNHYD